MSIFGQRLPAFPLLSARMASVAPTGGRNFLLFLKSIYTDGDERPVIVGKSKSFVMELKWAVG